MLFPGVEVSNPDPASSDLPSLGHLTDGTVVITTNDNAFGAFKIYSNSEGPGVQRIEVRETDRLAVDLIVERDGGSIGVVSVGWGVTTTSRTATSGLDYIADGATLVFEVGQKRRC